MNIGFSKTWILVFLLILIGGGIFTWQYAGKSRSDSGLGKEFQIKGGETGSIPSEGIKIEFMRVLEDSRCPESVQCIWAGQAKIQVHIVKDSQDFGNAELTLGGSEDLAIHSFDNYSLKLLRLDPYPQKPEEIKLSQYIATFILFKAEVRQGQTENWQTYRNEEYGFEMQYPESWSFYSSNAISPTLSDQSRNFVQISINNKMNQSEDESRIPCQPGFAALIFQIGRSRQNYGVFIDFEDFVNFLIENPERGQPSVPKPVLIQTMLGGYNALMIKDGRYDECESEFYYIDQKSGRFTTVSLIAEKDADKLIIDQLLSTFRFVE